MENVSLFGKISSKYIINLISLCLKEKDFISNRLIFYNKHAQEKLGFSLLFNYKEKYLFKKLNKIN